MKRTTIWGFFCITALVTFAVWAPNVLAYTAPNTCADCHDWVAVSHVNHQSRTGCATCHIDFGNPPTLVLTVDSCALCHDPSPLQSNHINNYGVSACAGCHPQSPPLPVCGNGTIDAGEQCDDGNTANNDGCSSTCQLEVCGDGTKQTNEQCDDGNQVNGDGCENDCTLTQAAPETNCNNGIDDDNDGDTDCQDTDCANATFGACDTGNLGICAAGALTCDGIIAGSVCTQNQAAGTEGPANDLTCSDGIDNDCDGQIDAADPDCITVSEICDNGIDDDNDTLIDCADPLCEGFVGQPGSCDTGLLGICASGTFTCSTGSDVCEQDQTAVAEGPFGDPSCTDGLDSDCDGLTDADDQDCHLISGVIPPGTDVLVTPVPEIELTFTEITAGGYFDIFEVSNPVSPEGNSIVGPVIDISFTGTINGPGSVCFAYDATGVQGAEESLKLFHMDAGDLWQDITTSVDTENDIICGEITSFSEFAVAEPQATAGGGGSSGCFIATAAYGSYVEPHVMTLRQFRDSYLLTNKPGAAFVEAYYKYSPSAANYIAHNEGLRSIARAGLAPLVGFSWLAIHYGMTTALLFLAGIITLCVGTTRLVLKTTRS